MRTDLLVRQIHNLVSRLFLPALSATHHQKLNHLPNFQAYMSPRLTVGPPGYFDSSISDQSQDYV